MALNMSPFSLAADDEAMNEINMIPFIDVMLVLLIVFIITVPVITHSVNIELPRASNEPEVIQPDALELGVEADGSYLLGGEAVSDEELPLRLSQSALQDPQPALHIRGAREVRYERVAQAMAAAQQAGLKKIAFVTEPQHE